MYGVASMYSTVSAHPLHLVKAIRVLLTVALFHARSSYLM